MKKLRSKLRKENEEREFANLIQQARKQAKVSKLKRRDIKSAIAKVRSKKLSE